MISLLVYSGAILALAFYLLKTLPDAKKAGYNKSGEDANEDARAQAELADYKSLFNQEFSDN